MKNIHVLPTDKTSRIYLIKSNNRLGITSNNPEFTENFGSGTQNQNIYITSDEEIKEGDWFYSPFQNEERILKYNKFVIPFPKDKKIILTTDQDLIKDGVQAIDDEFLEWFVNNPSCEEVEIIKQHQYHSSKEFYIDADYVNCSKEQYESIKEEIPNCSLRILYKIIIPKEEPKQETLEEAAEKQCEVEGWGLYEGLSEQYAIKNAFIEGAKWQCNRIYSEKEVISILHDYRNNFESYKNLQVLPNMFFNWFEKFKKK